jgi:protein-arginine kinase activator protein McsA
MSESKHGNGLCEMCQEQVAIVHLTTMMDGKTVTENLCAKCAEPRFKIGSAPPGSLDVG